MLELEHIVAGIEGGDTSSISLLSSGWRRIGFTGTVSDSREVIPDALFIALRGERTDGHQFLPDVAARGARGAIVDAAFVQQHRADLEAIQRPWVFFDVSSGTVAGVDSQHPPDSDVFVLVGVDHTLSALHRLAAYHRQLLSPTVVGITGSVGKTTTKEMTAAVLSQRYCTLKSKKSYNSEVTLPTTVLHLTAEHTMAVVELGMWAPGEIRQLAHLVRPHIGVVTNVGPSHMERMGSIEAIARAKAELVEALPQEGIAVLNADDERVVAMAQQSNAPVVWYGRNPSADIWADQIESLGLEGVSFVAHHGDEEARLRVSQPGVHQVSSALAATAVGRVLGVSWNDIAAGLQDRTMLARLLVIPVEQGNRRYTVIDDTYNASPLSMRAALELLAECDGRRVAVLGDMLELGPFEEEGHRLVGQHVAPIAHQLVCVGTRTHWIAEEAHRSGMSEQHIALVQQTDQAIPFVQNLVQTGDVVLVKGSRGIAMERIVTALAATERTPATSDRQRTDEPSWPKGGL